MTVPDRQLVTTALIAMLSTGTGKQVGDHKAPAVLTKGEPYAIVYSLTGGGYWGPGLVAPTASSDVVYQIDAIGATRAQAEWMGDRVRRTVLARTATGAFQVAFPAVAGWDMADREPAGGPGGVDVAGTPPNEVFTVAERFTLRLTPS